MSEHTQATEKKEMMLPVLCKVPLSNIHGLHPTLANLFSTLSIPPLRQTSLKTIKSVHLEQLLDVFPIKVSREKKRLRCTGNFRIFQVAQRFLPKDADVFCIEEIPLKEDKLKLRALTELVFGSGSFGIHSSDARVLMKIARHPVASNILGLTESEAEILISRLYGVDRRTLKVKT